MAFFVFRGIRSEDSDNDVFVHRSWGHVFPEGVPVEVTDEPVINKLRAHSLFNEVDTKAASTMKAQGIQAPQAVTSSKHTADNLALWDKAAAGVPLDEPVYDASPLEDTGEIEEIPDGVPLSALTVDQLKEMAKNEGITLPKGRPSKDKLVTIITEASFG